MKAHLPEAALIEAARGGDLPSLDRLLEVCRPDLQRYAALNCRAADAEDAVQESLLILHRNIGALRSIGAFAGWLFQIVRRECLRLARQVLPHQVALDEVEETLAARKNDPDLRLDIALAIQSLPDHYRAVIVLRDFEELSVQEIATRLSLPAATVKTRIHRGRHLIREHLLA